MEKNSLENFDFALSQEVKRAIEDMGYEEPTPIQRMTIEPLLQGKDLIGQAQTGTGKTAAFGIPMVDRIDTAKKSVQAIVLCPTRELAVQTAGEILKLGKYKTGLRTLAVYGGAPIERQLRELSFGVHIVVGTPGRVMDHLDRGSLDLSGVSLCILDEADEMLDICFREDIESILSRTNEQRQTALFSATMPFPIMTLAQKYLREPQCFRVENQSMTVDAIRQTYIPIRSFHKAELLSRLLLRDGISRALVFMNTKLGVEDVVTALQNRGFAAAGLHGDMRQIERDAIMARFKAGTVGILIATDVAARGLDIENVEAVFNYDIPLDVEQYVHRIGRTGRAGKEGRAYTFVVGRELSRLWDYRRITKAPILAENPPSGEEIRAAEEARYIEKALALANDETQTVSENARKLLEGADPLSVVSALLTMLDDTNGRRIHPEIDLKIPEPPKPAPKPHPQTGAKGGYNGYNRGERFAKAGEKPYRREGGKFQNDRPARPYEKPRGRAPENGKSHWDRSGRPDRRDAAAKPPRRFFDPRKGRPNGMTYPQAKKGHAKDGADEA